MLFFYHRFVPKMAEILAPLNELLKGYTKSSRNKFIKWDSYPNALKAFVAAKNALADATLLRYPAREGEITICTDASNLAVGAVLQQQQEGEWVPLSFFSRKLNKAEINLSTFGKELLAAYLSVKHFHHWIQGYAFTLYTDHKPLIGALEKPFNRTSGQESRQLSFIAQYRPKVLYIKGTKNIVADTLSRCTDALPIEEKRELISSLTLLPPIDHESLVEQQKSDPQLKILLDKADESALQLELIGDLYCNKFEKKIRPYVPHQLRREIFDKLHNSHHPGSKQTQRLVCERFVWPFMKRDIKKWVQQCDPCHRAKVTRHNRTIVQSIPNNVEKFAAVHMDLVGPLPSNQGYTYLLTMIDRFSRWPEVIPIEDLRADTVANAFMMHWVARSRGTIRKRFIREINANARL